MAKTSVAELLIARAFRSEVDDKDRKGAQEFLAFNRRTFLKGASFTLISSAFGFQRYSPTISTQRGVIVVSYGPHEWRIDPSLMGSHAHASWRRKDAGFVIVLKQATLPGTDLSIDFIVKLMPGLMGWTIHIRMPRIGFNGRTSLHGWFANDTPLRSRVRIRRIRLGRDWLNFSGSRVVVSFMPSFEFLFTGNDVSCGLQGLQACEGAQLALSLHSSATGTFRQAFLGSNTAAATAFQIIAPQTDNSPISFDHTPSASSVAFHPENVSTFSGEVYDGDSGPTGIVLLDGSGSVSLLHSSSAYTASSGIRLERASLVTTSSAEGHRAAIAGRVARTPHSIDAGGTVLTIAGDDEEPFYAEFRSAQHTDVRARARLLKTWLPMTDADCAIIDTANTPITIALRHELEEKIASSQSATVKPLYQSESQLLQIDTSVSGNELTQVKKTPDDTRSLVVLGPESAMVVDLQGAEINIRRGVDLFNLTYSFDGFDLYVHKGKAYLRRQRPKKGEPWPTARIVVKFPPQHIAEEWFDVQNPSTCMPNPPCFPDVSRARMSGPSRIVFVDAPKPGLDPKWKDIPFTIEALTEWSELSLVVNKRALEPEATFEAQMSIPGINPETEGADAMRMIAATLQPPNEYETSLEMTGRLLFSPAKSAMWTTPRGPINTKQTPLWHARLDGPGRKTVRAIWSHMMLPGRFNACEKLDNPSNCEEKGKSLLVLSGDDHWQIVGQTSIYGLPALRRIEDPNQEKPNDKVHDALKTLPRSRVIRPDKNYTYLKYFDDCLYDNKEPNAGIALPAPFADADIIMTSIGGTLVADWQGEPPLLLRCDEEVLKDREGNKIEWPCGFSVERFGYRSQIGRDIRCEVVRKGYLLPLGVRASYIRLTERRFFRHPKYHYPIAFPVRRTFLVIQKPEKKLPGVNQPFDSRDFPARRIVMLTTMTPDLVSPESKEIVQSGCDPSPSRDNTQHTGGVQIDPDGRVTFPEQPNSVLIFWPRVTRDYPGTPGDVEFKWTVDDDKTPIVSNLLFVENSALVLEPLMEKVVKYYRARPEQKGPPLQLRTARLSGARKRYAPTETDGETSFDTDSWLLSVRGRILPRPKENTDDKAKGESFLMDGRMEGNDQPPFYPFVESARMNVQSLDRLLGRPQGLIEVTFDPTYVEHGFSTSENPSEIYLDVLRPEIKLDVTGQGSTAGGLAKPNALVAALSRKIGLVGGVKRTHKMNGSQDDDASVNARLNDVLDYRNARTKAVPGQTLTESPFDFSKALAGKFDPKEFLGGVGKAKLLGIIELEQVLKVIDIDVAGATPRLLEKIGYGALGPASEALKRIQEIARDLGEPALSSLCALRTQIGKYFKEEECEPVKSICASRMQIDKYFEEQETGIKIKFRDLYPDLDDRLTTTIVVFDDALRQIKDANDLRKIFEPTNAVVVTAKALLTEFERTLRDPVPPLVKSKLNYLARTWEDIKKLVNDQYLDIGRRLLEEIVATAIKGFCEKVDSDPHKLGSVLFGTGGEVNCAQIVKNPTDALDRVGQTLFAQVFAEPLVEILAYLLDYRAEVTAQISFARHAVVRQVLQIVHEAAEALRDRLTPPTQNANTEENILDGRTQQKLVEAILDEIQKIIDIASKPEDNSPNDIDAVRRRLDAIKKAVQEAGPSIEKVIEAQKAVFKAKVSSEINAIVRDFQDRTVNKIVSAAETVVRREVDRIKALLLTRLQETRAEAIKRLLGAVERIVTAMAPSVLFARVAQLGRVAEEWCGREAGPQTAKAIFFADDMANGLLGKFRDMADSIAEIAQKAQDIQLPPDTPQELREKFEAARTTLLVGNQQLAQTIQDLEKKRTELGALRKSVENDQFKDICSKIGQLLNPVGMLMNLRRDAVARIQEIANQTVIIEELIAEASARLNLAKVSTTIGLSMRTEMALRNGLQTIQVALNDIVKASAKLLKAVTSIGTAGSAGKWGDVEVNIKAIQKIIGSELPSYATELDNRTKEIVGLAQSFRTELGAATLDPKKLRDVAARSLDYAIKHDKRVAALVLQSVALVENLSKELGEQSAKILSGTADLLLAFHRKGDDLLGLLLEALKTPVVELIINPEVVKRFEAAKVEVLADAKRLEAIVKAGTDPKAALDASELLKERWKKNPPALVNALTVLAGLIEHFLRGDLASIIDVPNIREAVKAAEENLKQIVTKLLPTRADLAYTWKTGIGRFPDQEKPFFEMTEGRSADDLTLDAQISVDFISGARQSVVTGKLKPFKIKLLGSIDMVTIFFKEARFESRDGSTPQFKAEIDDVQLGPVLEFIKPLQAWLSPGDNGFYVKPITSPGLGIEAGYVYDAGIIQIGNLQFINVAIGVAARLPFDDHAAEFEFRFASVERPFLIAAPPYGGGGYVKLVANAKGITGFGLSFMFGGVVALKFGPLNAQGRVTAGFYLEQTEETRSVAAIVEAVGEGSIACFSICVFIQVGLRQQYPNRIEGFSIYSFEFKLGFVKLRYGFKATYTFPGQNTPSVSGLTSMLLEAQQADNRTCTSRDTCVDPKDENARRITNLAPRKSTEWNEYRNHIAMDLLSK